MKKLLVWTSLPTHHQSAFFAALRRSPADLKVLYYNHRSEHRSEHGWVRPTIDSDYEQLAAPSLRSLLLTPDWRTRVHILPGCGTLFGTALALALSITRTRWIHWSEASNPNQPNQWVKQIVRRLYAHLVNQHAIGALAIGRNASIDFQRWGIRAELIKEVPYAIAPLTSTPFSGQEAGAEQITRFLFLGALCQRKGVDTLIEAFSMLLRVHPQARLSIVGHDEGNGFFQRLAQKLRIDEFVAFLPSVPSNAVGDVISTHDILVLPSRFDGWGMVLAEAASAGRALIATTSCGAAQHLIKDGQSGFQVPPSDPTALARAMSYYCQNSALAALHGRFAKVLFEELSPERNATRMISAIEELQRRRIALSR